MFARFSWPHDTRPCVLILYKGLCWIAILLANLNIHVHDFLFLCWRPTMAWFLPLFCYLMYISIPIHKPCVFTFLNWLPYTPISTSLCHAYSVNQIRKTLKTLSYFYILWTLATIHHLWCLFNYTVSDNYLFLICYRWWSVADSSNQVSGSTVDLNQNQGSEWRYSILYEICVCECALLYKMWSVNIFFNIEWNAYCRSTWKRNLSTTLGCF